MRILNTIGDIYSDEAKHILGKIAEVDYLNLSKQTDLEKIIAGYDILIVGLGLNITKKIISKGTRLKILATATTGHDHIDMDYAKESGITVLSLRGERKFLDTVTGTAEMAFALMLNISRNILPAVASAKKYCWTKKFKGHNLYGKTLGIVGLGRLGSMIARYGKSFNMKVLAYDPYLEKKYFDKIGVKKVDFIDLLKKSDYVSIHVHLSKETENMFNGDVFGIMKRGAYLINTSRGKIVSEDDLLLFLKEKKIGGYATDVLADELSFNNKFKENSLLEYSKRNDNVIVTPHIGGVTFESREMTDIFIAKKVRRFANKLN